MQCSKKESSSDQLVGAGEERRRSSLPMHVPKHDWLHGRIFGCRICGRKLQIVGTFPTK
jgi:hypothetical protein